MEEQKVPHERFLIEIGTGNRCEFNRPEFDVYLFVFLSNEGDIAEIAEKVVDTAVANFFVEIELQHG